MTGLANLSAFPVGDGAEGGMTIREWMVGMAMMGVLASGEQYDTPDAMARDAIIAADATIAQLEAGRAN